jgi:TPR repeat protein
VFQQSWVKRAQIRTGIKHSVNGRLLSLPTLRENAEKGDAIAQYKLGSSYLSGSGGVQQDYAEAAN